MRRTPGSRCARYCTAAPPGRHRRVVLGALLAVAGVVVGLLALLVVTSPGSGDPTVAEPPPGAQAGTRSISTASPGVSRDPSPRTTPSTSAAGTPGSSAVPSAAVPPATPAASPTASPSAAPAVPPVTVLNNSRRTGLAARVAQDVTAAGLQVASVGNYSTGRLPVTTLFYAPGQQAAAQQVAAALPGIARVLPLSGDVPAGQGLTLVVTREYPA